LEGLELELFGNKKCCQFSQYPKHIPSHGITHNLVPRFVYSMKPPHHQNNGQAIKNIRELLQAWVVGLNSLVQWEEGIDGLSSCIQVFSL
jgi:hypothetical protein